MNRIYFVGDTHGLHDANKLLLLKEREELDYLDYVIICGDAGIVWHQDLLDEFIDFYESIGANILYVDGNHENYDMLKKYPVTTFCGGKVQKISEHIYHLMRGQVFTILGRKIFTLGGADSTDKATRVEHLSWWADEQITSEDIVESKENLKKHNNTVDYVVTHALPSSTLEEIVEVFTQCGEEVPYYLTRKLRPTPSSEYLDEIKKIVKFKCWYAGHLHIDEKVENLQVLYCDVERIKG